MNQTPMHPYIAFLWETITIEFMIKFFIVYFFIVWITLIIWVVRDIAHRSQSLIFQSFCVLLIIIFSPLGIFLYLLIRPGKSMYEKYAIEIEENLEILNQIVEERLGHGKNGNLLCPKCSEYIEPDFIICPNCKVSLKHTCHECLKEIRENWKVCPYCQTKQKSKKK